MIIVLFQFLSLRASSPRSSGGGVVLVGFRFLVPLIFSFLLGGLLGESREKIVLDKKDAFNFFSALKSSINHECYEEDCTFGEVVDHYGSSEQAVGLHRRSIFLNRKQTVN